MFFSNVYRMFTDVHCHLYFFEYYKELIERAKTNNVNLMLSNSTSFKSLELNKKIALEYPKNVKAAYALHPCDLLKMDKKEIEEGFQWIKENLSGKECIGIGETGLDYKYAETEEQRGLQDECFERHINIAVEAELPIVVHSRRAQEKSLGMLEEGKAEKVLMHWFYGNKKVLKKTLDLEYFISVSPGMVNREDTIGFVKKLPLERILLETDASPVKFDGVHSEPAWIVELAGKVAELKEVSVKELEKQLEKNLKELFKI